MSNQKDEEQRKPKLSLYQRDSNNSNKNNNKNNNKNVPFGLSQADSQKITIMPYKKDYLKIVKGDHYYLLDRYKYDINTIMMLLDLNKINKFHDIYEYKEFKDGVEKAIFVEIMKKELPYNPNDPMDETNIVFGLYKFFCEIDFNGDGHMQWEEFTQFIIDTVEGDNDARVDEDDDENKNKVFNEKQMIKFKRYNISQRLKDNLIHKKDVIAAVFIPRVDLIAINEYSTKIIKLYNPKTGRNIKIFDLESYINPKNYLESDNKSYYKKKLMEKKNYSLSPDVKSSLINKNKQNGASSSVINLYYSVLYMTQYQNIVAMCLSDKRIIFFHFAADDRIEIIHEMHLPVIEKRVWFLPEHNIWVSSGTKLDKYNYYTLNELDIEFSYYNQKYECLYNEGHSYRKHYCDIFPHRGEIMDCIEITKPMMVVTACMDSKIRLINLSDREIVKVWSNHTLGVRSLDYNPLIEHIGYVLSVGFEYFINVYCPDLSIDDAYKGRLEGHFAPVISCKFLSYSYMAVSVDEEANIRIWDTRAKICLQLIPTPKKNFKVEGLLGLFKYNKFIVYGNKMIYYDAKYKEEQIIQKNQVTDDNYPIKVDYNYYYNQFFVTTFRDVRIYSKEGTIHKIYKKLNSNEHFDSNTKIRTFIFENNYRKFYVGFSNGAIMQYNAGNGSLVKPINEEETERDGISYYTYSHSKEIASLYFFHEDNNKNNITNNNNKENNNNPLTTDLIINTFKPPEEKILLISTSYDSLINIYDERNSEETEKLRTIRGGHTIGGKVYEINCMDFSKTLNLFATGSSDGLIVVWDFEMTKIDDVFYFLGRIKLSVVFLKFLDPYPVLAASYTNGLLYLWGIKQCQRRGECLLRARNYTKMFYKIDTTVIRYMNIFEGRVKLMKENVLLKKYFDEKSPFMNPGMDFTSIMEEMKKKREEEKREREKIKKNKYKRIEISKLLGNFKINGNNNDSEEESEEELKDEDFNLDIVPKNYQNEIIDKEIDYELYLEKGKNIYEDILPHYYLILGDERGFLKILDLMGFFKKYKIEPASQVIIKSTFNLLKKEDINVEAIINHNLEPKEEDKFPKFLNLYYKVIQVEFKAHMEEITCITIIEEPLCFASSSKDKFVKIWNFNCECIGVINSLPKLTKGNESLVKWNFKVNEEKILEREISDVVNIFEKVGVEPILIGSKLDKEVDELIVIPEKVEERKKTAKDNLQTIKRKFKKIEKETKVKKKNVEEAKINISYEGYYVQTAQRNIENMINIEPPNQGINEITEKVINTIVENNNEMKKIKQKRKEQKKLQEIIEEQHLNKSIRKMSFKNKSNQKNNPIKINQVGSKHVNNFFNKQTSNGNQNLTNEMNYINNNKEIINNKDSNKENNENENEENNNNSNNNGKKKLLPFTKKNLYHPKTLMKNVQNIYVSPSINNAISFQEIKEDENNKNISINNTSQPQNQNQNLSTASTIMTKRINSYKILSPPHNQKTNNITEGEVLGTMSPENFESGRLNLEGRGELSQRFNKTISNRKIKKNGNRVIGFRDELFSKKFFGKTLNSNKFGEEKKKFLGCFSPEIERQIRKITKLPVLNDKIIFKKGETEKLLNYQFYSTSYRACCEVGNQNNVPNSSIKTNYRNNWKLVKQYVNEQTDFDSLNNKMNKHRSVKSFNNYNYNLKYDKNSKSKDKNYKKYSNKSGNKIMTTNGTGGKLYSNVNTKYGNSPTDLNLYDDKSDDM